MFYCHNSEMHTVLLEICGWFNAEIGRCLSFLTVRGLIKLLVIKKNLISQNAV